MEWLTMTQPDTTPSPAAPLGEERVGRNKSPFEIVAAYLSGSSVALHSIGLQLGGHSKMGADAFFTFRRALGVEGYDDADKIEAMLSASIAVEPAQ